MVSPHCVQRRSWKSSGSGPDRQGTCLDAPHQGQDMESVGLLVDSSVVEPVRVIVDLVGKKKRAAFHFCLVYTRMVESTSRERRSAGCSLTESGRLACLGRPR